MNIEYIQPPDLPRPAAYSHVVKAGQTVYLAGQVPQDANGQVVGRGDITAQAEQVFQNLRSGLRAAGGDLQNLVKITIFVTDPRFREAVGAVRTRYLQDPLPASTLVCVAALAMPEWLLEIEGIAVLDG